MTNPVVDRSKATELGAVVHPVKKANRESVPIVIEMCGDRFIRCYHDKGAANVVIFNRPVATSAKAGQLVDGIIDAVLPFRHKQVYSPGNCRKTAILKRTTIADIQQTVSDLRTDEAIRTISDPKRRRDSGNRTVARAMGVAR